MQNKCTFLQLQKKKKKYFTRTNDNGDDVAASADILDNYVIANVYDYNDVVANFSFHNRNNNT